MWNKKDWPRVVFIATKKLPKSQNGQFQTWFFFIVLLSICGRSTCEDDMEECSDVVTDCADDAGQAKQRDERLGTTSKQILKQI